MFFEILWFILGIVIYLALIYLVCLLIGITLLQGIAFISLHLVLGFILSAIADMLKHDGGM